MKSVVVDVQFFKVGAKQLVPKELATFDGEYISHYLFKPPFTFNCLTEEYQNEANWLMNQHHCILWESGFVPVYQLKNIITDLGNAYDVFYVKGTEKATFLKQYTKKPVLELDEQPRLQQATPRCRFHSKIFCMCALTNVYQLYNNFFM